MKAALVLLTTLLIHGALACGCAAPAPDPLATPTQLTFDVTILKGDKVPFRSEAWLRPGKMIVFPDGTLLADFGPSVNTRVRPGVARVLYQRQVFEMWDVAKKLGFSDPELADFAANPYLVEAQPNEIVYIMTFAASGDRWTFVRRFEGTGEPDPASEVWVKVLAQAAFATDLAADADLPIRYDFGPDPYAWFKPPAK
ncbi:MAG: hypothetical protein WCQ03_07255 [Phycisphaerae bacterium]